MQGLGLPICDSAEVAEAHLPELSQPVKLQRLRLVQRRPFT